MIKVAINICFSMRPCCCSQTVAKSITLYHVSLYFVTFCNTTIEQLSRFHFILRYSINLKYGNYCYHWAIVMFNTCYQSNGSHVTKGRYLKLCYSYEQRTLTTNECSWNLISTYSWRMLKTHTKHIWNQLDGIP